MNKSKRINITKEQFEEWQSSLRYKWVRWFQYTWIGEFWHSIKAGIPSLLKWVKITWKDRDYDYYYIYSALKFKINNTLKYIDKHKRSVDYKQDVFWMQICVNLIDKVSDEYYSIEYLDYRKTKLRFEKIDDSDMSELHMDILEDNLDEYLNKYPTWRRRAIEHIKKNKDRYTSDHNDIELQALIMGKLRHDKARKLFFDIIQEKIESWWD